MKKLVCFLCICLLSLVISVPVSAAEVKDENITSNDPVLDFMNMQDEITQSMSIFEGVYVYDSDIIRDIIYKYDFESVNTKLGTKYTNELFFEEAMTNIENTTFLNDDNYYNVCPAWAGMCEQSWESSGWNYERAALSDKETTGYISDCKNWAVALATSGSLAGWSTAAVPPLAGVLLGASALGVAWYTMVGNSLSSKQIQADGCGVVIDINKFTYYYSIWTQPEF